jgi:hypothetical protein
MQMRTAVTVVSNSRLRCLLAIFVVATFGTSSLAHAQEPPMPDKTNTLYAADFGFKCDAETDNTPIWRHIMTRAQTLVHGERTLGLTIVIPPGECKFLSKPDPIVTTLRVRGAANFTTTLVRLYTPQSDREPFLDVSAGMITLEDLLIVAAPNTSRGSAIFGGSVPGAAPAFLQLKGLYLSSLGAAPSGLWFRGIDLDGTNTGVSGGGGGIRSALIDNVNVFQATETSVSLMGVKNLRASNLNLVNTPASPSRASLFIGEGGGVSSDNVLVSGASLGDVVLDGAISCTIMAGAANHITTTRRTYDCVIVSPVVGGKIKIGGVNNQHLPVRVLGSAPPVHRAKARR